MMLAERAQITEHLNQESKAAIRKGASAPFLWIEINLIGLPEMTIVSPDLHFDPEARAFYCPRVLVCAPEIWR